MTQGTPPQNESAHDALTEICFGDQKGSQPLRGNQQCLDLALRRPLHERRAMGKLTNLGQELTRTLLCDRRHLTQAVTLRDRDKARQHSEQPGLTVTYRAQHLTL